MTFVNHRENGWNDFVVDENNAVASALGEDGACPDVGSELYLAGLTVGDTRLQLTLQDGGPTMWTKLTVTQGSEYRQDAAVSSDH